MQTIHKSGSLIPTNKPPLPLPSSAPPTPRYDRYCADHYGDGVCDRSCNKEACGWDGLDCSADKPPKVADGTLVIVVLLQPDELLKDMLGFLRSLGTLLHTNLRVRRDKDQKPMVFPYYGPEVGQEGGQEARRSHAGRAKRELAQEVIG